MPAKLIKVIKTDFELRGTGKDGDPYRRIIQYWSLKGVLLWELDHYLESKQNKTKNNS